MQRGFRPYPSAPWRRVDSCPRPQGSRAPAPGRRVTRTFVARLGRNAQTGRSTRGRVEAMDWAISAAGGVLVLIGLRELFHTLFHPTGEPWLSRAVVGVTWRLVKRIDRRKSLLVLAGPLGMVNVFFVWVGLLGAGFALVVWPHLEENFVFQNLDPAEHSGFVDALYFSFVTLATLGYGEITPATTLFRLVTPGEAMIGFVLLTAVISWVLSIYPALTRLRRLAVAVNTFTDARERVPDASFARTFHDFADRTLEVRMDFVHHPVIYYFHAPDLRSRLPAALPVLRR